MTHSVAQATGPRVLYDHPDTVRQQIASLAVNDVDTLADIAAGLLDDLETERAAVTRIQDLAASWREPGASFFPAFAASLESVLYGTPVEPEMEVDRG